MEKYIAKLETPGVIEIEIRIRILGGGMDIPGTTQ